MTATVLPRTDPEQASGWSAILPDRVPAPPLSGAHSADCVVVGAGVTGLAAARRLGELNPEARIVLIEGCQIGHGASARNSGFIIDTPHLSEKLSEDENRSISRLVVAGLEELKAQVDRHGIDCEWSPRGHLTACVDPAHEKNLHETVRTLKASGEDYRWYDKDALSKVVGTRHYHAAVLTPRTVLVNPAALCRGLADTLPPNVELFEDTQVTGVRGGSPARVDCAGGSVVAKSVLLTTNAFITRLGYLRRDVFPLIECASLSRELTAEELAGMGGQRDWGITGHATLRKTLSRRILVRHGTFYSGDYRLRPSMKRRLQTAHLAGLRKRFPGLGKLRFDHTWAGVFCMTRNWASFFGRLDEGVFGALGYCGVGMARGTISGRLLAEIVTGAESELIEHVKRVSGPRRLPPEPVLGLGIRAKLAQHRWTNRTEW